MEEKVKALEKHLEIVSQINLKMESLQTKIEELDKWRNMEKNVPSGLPTVRAYDIRLHTLATNECQELASKFEEIFNIFNGPRSISEMNIQFLFLSSKRSRISMK